MCPLSWLSHPRGTAARAVTILPNLGVYGKLLSWCQISVWFRITFVATDLFFSCLDLNRCSKLLRAVAIFGSLSQPILLVASNGCHNQLVTTRNISRIILLVTKRKVVMTHFVGRHMKGWVPRVFIYFFFEDFSSMICHVPHAGFQCLFKRHVSASRQLFDFKGYSHFFIRPWQTWGRRPQHTNALPLAGL